MTCRIPDMGTAVLPGVFDGRAGQAHVARETSSGRSNTGAGFCYACVRASGGGTSAQTTLHTRDRRTDALRSE